MPLNINNKRLCLNYVRMWGRLWAPAEWDALLLFDLLMYFHLWRPVLLKTPLLLSMFSSGVQGGGRGVGDPGSAGRRRHGGHEGSRPPQYPDVRLAVLQLLPWTLPEWVSMSRRVSPRPPLSPPLSLSDLSVCVCVFAHSRWFGRH